LSRGVTEVSEALRQVREDAGLTLQQLANRAGVSRPTIEKAEAGKEAIRKVSASRIVNALNDLAGTAHTIEGLGIITSKR
jgi:transcriptional regulator with XRE-family HTH domain